jgi:hypothetical protein
MVKVVVAVGHGFRESAEPLLPEEDGQPLPIDSRLASVSSNGNSLAPQFALELGLRLLKEFRNISHSN